MTLVKQTDDVVDNANAYVDVAEATAYLTTLGRESAWLALASDEVRAEAIVSSWQWMDTFYSGCYKGTKTQAGQTTQFPRNGATDEDGFEVEGVPPPVKVANSLAALKYAAGELYVDQRVTAGATAGTYTRREKLGPLEREFAESSGAASSVTESRFPEIENLLRPFFSSDTEVLVG